MKVVFDKTFSVMEGEPALGKQNEKIIKVDRYEYVNTLITAFLEGDVTHIDDSVLVEDGDYEQTYGMDYCFTQKEIDTINYTLEQTLSDEDWSNGNSHELARRLIDTVVPEDWSSEFEVVTMKGF